MFPLQRGKYRARLAVNAADLIQAQRLRHLSFRGRGGTAGLGTAGQGTAGQGRDEDGFDMRCRHILIEDISSGTLVCCYRLLRVASGESLADSYAGQFYDLTSLQGFAGAKLELGRFCLDPAWHDPDILRLAWGAITAIVDAEDVGLLFGCSSFTGTDPSPYSPALAALCQHLAPSDWPIRINSATIFPFAAVLTDSPRDLRAAMQAMPPLLRTYLAMGGWVSDHAVIDHDLDTLHVFTAVEIARIPVARARALRLVAADPATHHADN